MLDGILSLKNLFNMFENSLFFHTSKLFKHIMNQWVLVSFMLRFESVQISIDTYIDWKVRKGRSSFPGSGASKKDEGTLE